MWTGVHGGFWSRIAHRRTTNMVDTIPFDDPRDAAAAARLIAQDEEVNELRARYRAAVDAGDVAPVACRKCGGTGDGCDDHYIRPEDMEEALRGARLWP